MHWELYEVWAVQDGHEELVDTTNSLQEAREWATKGIEEQGYDEVVIYRERGDFGELEFVESFTASD